MVVRSIPVDNSWCGLHLAKHFVSLVVVSDDRL
jgi:hypothetical protein